MTHKKESLLKEVSVFLVILSLILLSSCFFYNTEAFGDTLIVQPLAKISYSDGFIANSIPRNGRAHLAQDYAASVGTAVKAIADGKVVRVFWSDSSGMNVIIEHDINGEKAWTRSCHHRKGSVAVSVGDTVTAGQKVAEVGDAGSSCHGAHLHFQIVTGKQPDWGAVYLEGTWPRGEEVNGPITHKGTTYWSPKRVIAGLDVIGDPTPVSTLEFRNVEYPSTFKKNSNPGWNLGTGSLASNVNLTSIRSILYKNDGSWSQDTGDIAISGRKYSISAINSRVKYSQIPSTGSYTWKLIGKDESGKELPFELPITVNDSGSTSTKRASLTYDEYQAKNQKVSSIELQDQGGYDITSDTMTYYDYNTVGNDYYVQAWVDPSNVSNPSLSWSSSNTNVLSLSSSSDLGNGGTLAIFKIQGRGVSTITATSRDGSNVSSSFTFELKAPTSSTISLPSTEVVETGYSKKLSATLDAGGDISWSTSDPSTVIVSGDGYVYGCKPGIAYVTATAYDNSSVTATCAVTVEAPNRIEEFRSGWESSRLVSGDDRSTILSFTPTFTGYYVFESCYDPVDTYGYVYDDSWQLLAEDDDSGENNHFKIRYCFIEGQTYYLVARLYNPFEDDALTVCLDQNNNIQALPLNSNQEAVVEEYGAVAYFSFSPASSGNYAFGSNTTSEDTCAYLYDANWNLIGFDDDSGEGYNFALNMYLDGGETYYLGTRFYSPSITGSFYISAQNYVPVESISLWDENSITYYLDVGTNFDYLPEVSPSTATNKQIVFPEFNDGVIAVDSNGTVHGIGCGWSSFVAYSADNPDIEFVYNFAVCDVDYDNQPAWHPDNLQVKSNGSIAFDIVADGSGTFNHFVLTFPGCQKISSSPLQDGLVIGGLSDYFDIYPEDDNNMIQYGNVAHIEILPNNLDQYWGSTQSFELTGRPMFGYYSVFPDTGLKWFQELTIPVATVFPEMISDFTTPSAVGTIEEEAFCNIAAKRIRIADKVTRINSKAFANCNKLICVSIPEGCTSIASDAFMGDAALIIYGKSGSYAETYANQKGFAFCPIRTLAQRIQQYIMATGDYTSYDAALDLNGDGVINSADYVLARKAE